MRSKEDLFHLIKAMSKSEKRYFTLDAQKSGKKGSKYLDLFQAINNMEEYDELKLKKKFAKNLPSDKAYLYDAILRSMRDYRSSKSKAAQIKEMILDSKYLYERGLYSQCEERLKEAEELAGQMDDQLSTLEIIKEKRQLVWDLRKKNYEQEIKGIIGEKEDSLNRLKEEFKLLDLYDQLSTMVMKKPDLEDEESRQALKQQFQIEALESEKEPISSHALRRFYQCAAIYYHLLGDFDKVQIYYQKVVDWWDANPLYKDEEFYKYVVDISNLLHAWYRKGQFHNFPELLTKIESEIPTNLHDQTIAFQKLSIYKLLYYINSGKEDGVDELVKEIDYGLRQFNINPARKLVLLVNVSFLLFMHNSYKACIEWCEKIIQGRKMPSRQYIKGIYLLHMVAVFETDDLDLIEQTYRSIYRFFTQKAEVDKDSFEMHVLDYIRKIINAPLGDLNDIYRSFQQFLSEAKKSKTYKINLGGIEELLLFWVNSKLEKRTILQVMTG